MAKSSDNDQNGSKRKLKRICRNVRTLVESTGDERVCRKRAVRTRNNLGMVDRKLDLVVSELKRYRVSVAGIVAMFGMLVSIPSYIPVVHCLVQMGAL